MEIIICFLICVFFIVLLYNTIESSSNVDAQLESYFSKYNPYSFLKEYSLDLLKNEKDKVHKEIIDLYNSLKIPDIKTSLKVDLMFYLEERKNYLKDINIAISIKEEKK